MPKPALRSVEAMQALARKRIPVAGPSITEREIRYIADAAETCWFDQANLYHDRFERAFAGYIGVRHAMALPSCTSAIHLSLAALGIGPGDEVIVPEITWIASSAPISYLGATPVFVDVERDTWCIDPEAVRAALTSRTRAVIAVDLYGNMPRMAALRAVLDPRGIPLIEDAAEAVGSSVEGRLAGSFGLVGVFSFHGSKTLTTGEGGMLVTDDEALFRRAQVLRDHGRRPGDVAFFNAEVGFKYKMSSFQAACGLAQLERIDELVAGKRRIFQAYQDRLAGVAGLALNPEPAGARHAVWMTTVLVDPALGWTKDRLGAALGDRGVDTRPFFHPLSSLPAYRDTPAGREGRARNPCAYALAGQGLNLPSGLQLTEDDIDFVVAELLDVLGLTP